MWTLTLTPEARKSVGALALAVARHEVRRIAHGRCAHVATGKCGRPQLRGQRWGNERGGREHRVRHYTLALENHWRPSAPRQLPAARHAEVARVQVPPEQVRFASLRLGHAGHGAHTRPSRARKELHR